MRKKSFEEYVIEANKIHNHKYTYLQMYKKGKYNYLDIKCKIHGIFKKRTGNHISRKQGCSLCSKPSVLNNDIFIKRANEIHKTKYDYSKVDYVNNNTKVIIICNEHGCFKQTLKNHIDNKQGCPKCRKNYKMNKKDFIKKATKVHGNKYIYDESIYTGSHNSITIKCKEHGYYTQKSTDHLSGNGCYKCNGKIRTTEDFIEKANKKHDNLYNYTKSIYVNARKKIIITCKVHGDFKQSPNDHLNGCGCQKCGIT